MLSGRDFPSGVTSCEGERVQMRFVPGNFAAANRVLKGVPGKKTSHLRNGVGGVIVKPGAFSTLNQMGNGFVRSMIWFIIMNYFWKMRCIS